MTRIDAGIDVVLRRCWRSKVTVASDFARKHAVIVACAASKGFLSMWIRDTKYSNQWHITTKGLKWLTEQE
jgi:hypothetical protein